MLRTATLLAPEICEMFSNFSMPLLSPKVACLDRCFLQFMLYWCKNIGMRHSEQKNNVARLRVELNKFEKFDQEQFAKLIGCSLWKLRNIELGRTPLDELLARRISDETGIALEWLLENDTEAPLIAAESPVIPDRRGRFTAAAFKRAVLMRKRGVPFTIEAYKHTRMQRDFGVPTMRESLALGLGSMYAIIFYGWMRALFSTKNADIALWKTGRFLEQLASQYGHSRDVLPESHLEVAALRDHEVQWQQVKRGLRLAQKYARNWQRSERPRKRSRRWKKIRIGTKTLYKSPSGRRTKQPPSSAPPRRRKK